MGEALALPRSRPEPAVGWAAPSQACVALLQRSVQHDYLGVIDEPTAGDYSRRAMATASASLEVGPLLRKWREQRRMTQMELALDAGISARHLSFVETGRSKPGRAMLLQVAERLAIPYRERNEILLAAGYAPAFPERSLQDQALAPVRNALDRILAAHEPYPGIVFDRGWNVVAANSGMRSTG
jgi:transcriptional regulator with XRE-family HTH domain